MKRFKMHLVIPSPVVACSSSFTIRVLFLERTSPRDNLAATFDLCRT